MTLAAPAEPWLLSLCSLENRGTLWLFGKKKKKKRSHQPSKMLTSPLIMAGDDLSNKVQSLADW